jgi:RimJ/RimL family protein N-acetyltransferase
MNTEQKSASATPFEAKADHAFVCTEVEIVANRIAPKPISEEYARDIFRNFSSEVTRYMVPKPPDRIEETLDFIRSSRDGMKRDDILQFVVADKKSGEFLGCCGPHGHEKPKTPELGIWIKIAAHGNGYGR